MSYNLVQENDDHREIIFSDVQNLVMQFGEIGKHFLEIQMLVLVKHASEIAVEKVKIVDHLVGQALRSQHQKPENR